LNIFEELRITLIKKIDSKLLKEKELLRLLEIIFPYIELKEFESVVFSLLSNLKNIPKKFIEKLKNEEDIFNVSILII
jgi:deoxyhypusine synthase